MKAYRPQALIALLPLIGSLTVAPAMAAEGTKKIRRLGNPATTISTKDTKTDADLKARVEQYRDALTVILAQSSFDGDPEDLFDAVKNGNFERTSVPVGSTFAWMARRDKGQPSLAHNVEWAGSAPFEAWRLRVESQSATYTFVIPGTCLNLALESRTPRPPLSCTLEASAASSTETTLGAVTISGSARPSGDLTITGIGGPSRALDAGQARSAGAGRWTFQPDAPGAYRFDAQVRDAYGREAMCSATARVAPLAIPPKPEPECRLTGSYDEATGLITIDSSGTKGDIKVTGVMGPDGATISPDGGNGRWTFPVDRRTKRRGGTYKITAEASIEDRVDRCRDVQVVVPERPGVDGRWVLRAFGFTGNGDDRQNFDTFGPAGGLEQNSLAVDAPSGVGLALEYLFNDRVGIEGAALFGNADTDYALDLADAWLRGSDDVSFTAFTLGVNFHLTPDRRVDVYIGPFVGLASYDDASFNFGVNSRRFDFDDETGIGAQIGLDVPFTSDGRWGFNTALRYLESSAEDDRFNPEVELEPDPLLFSAGISFQF